MLICSGLQSIDATDYMGRQAGRLQVIVEAVEEGDVKPQQSGDVIPHQPQHHLMSATDRHQATNQRGLSTTTVFIVCSSSFPKIKLRRESEYPRLDLILEQKERSISTSCMQRPDSPAVGSIIRRS